MILPIQIEGQLALWNHPGDGLQAYSCAGPSPSAISGLIGAAFGFRWEKPNVKNKETFSKLPWPTAKKLIQFLKETELELAVACNPSMLPIKRINHNINGLKDKSWGTLRMEQSIILNPSYTVLFKTKTDEQAEQLKIALLRPTFGLHFGRMEFPAFANINNKLETPPHQWAKWQKDETNINESSPAYFLVLNSPETKGRIEQDGYLDWTPEEQKGPNWIQVGTRV